MLREPEVKRAAILSLKLGIGERYLYKSVEKVKGNHGVDLPLWKNSYEHGLILVGMVECKTAIDPWRGNAYNSPYASIYKGLGQLMFHGRAAHADLPLALFVGASGYSVSDCKPILSRAIDNNGRSVEATIRETLTNLGIDLIVCARVGEQYVLNGDQAFLNRVEAYLKCERDRRIHS